MKRVRTIDTCVTLVTVSNVSSLMQPKIGEYDNPYILKTQPCAKKNGKYYDLRSGEQVLKADEMMEWNNLTGSLFRYPDGYELLLSKRFDGNKILVFEPRGHGFNPESMILRKVIVRDEKNSA